MIFTLYVREVLSMQVCKGRGKGGGGLSSWGWAFFTILDSIVCTGKWAFSDACWGVWDSARFIVKQHEMSPL